MSFQTHLLHLPNTIVDAARLLANGDDRVCLAGGGLVVPDLQSNPSRQLVSLRHIPAMRGIKRERDGVRINAMTCHADVARSALLHGGLAVVRQAAAEIAHPAICNMATIGGTVCRANPAADFASALLAAGAMIYLASVKGERVMPIGAFTRSDDETARRRDEIVVAVTLPGDEGDGSAGYARFSRVDGDYPLVTAAVRLAWEDGRVSMARVAVGGCGPIAYRCTGAESQLVGLVSAAQVPSSLFDAYVAHAMPIDDLGGSAQYRLLLIPSLLRRAIAQAFAGAPL